MAHADPAVADGLCSIVEACKFLAVGRSTVYGAMERGELPYVKIGKARRIPRRALVHFAQQRLRGGWKADSG